MIGIGSNQQGDGPMPPGDHHLGSGIRVARVAFAIEDRVRIVFLRLMIEDQDDLSARVNSSVIVVLQLRSADPEAREDDASFIYAVVWIVAGEIGSMQSLAAHLEKRIVTIHLVFDQGDRLKKRIAHSG